MVGLTLSAVGECLTQGVKVRTLGRQNVRNISYVRLAHTYIFGLCFTSVYLMKSNCYSLIYSSLVNAKSCDFHLVIHPNREHVG